MTRNQIKYFGTKRQRAALKRGGKKKRKARVAGVSKKRRKTRVAGAVKKHRKRRTSTKTVVVHRSKKRRRSGITGMKFSKGNIVPALIKGGAAFGGGYAASMIEENLPIDDPTNRSLAMGAIGVVLTMMDPTGPIGAAGMGVLGAAGQSMNADAGAGGGEGTAGLRRRKRGGSTRLTEFRKAMQSRLNGNGRRVITGMPDDRTVITGPGRPGASYQSRF